MLTMDVRPWLQRDHHGITQRSNLCTKFWGRGLGRRQKQAEPEEEVQCQCHACLPENRAQSDANRAKLAKLYDAFPATGQNPNRAKILANEMLKLIEAEGGTEARVGDICYEAYQIMIVHRGNEAAAKAFISKAYHG
eukprot:TRINITY_DN5973_c0_g1_i1.p2 TRINITY_DN5973_c0_g1~~TRINITY_DN5973_c0_g1_i1.p2  ORF type:complete len:137 (-),score=8.52 TRINITY_DN5973_c0_g1_i1:350-760(-)